MRGVYTVAGEISGVTTAKTLLQIKAGPNIVVEILRMWVTQSTGDISDTSAIQILRKTAAATVTSVTPRKHENGDQAAASVGGTAASGIDASVEGTDGDIIPTEGFNLLGQGFVWAPIPEERIWIPPAGFLAIRLDVDITSATLIVGATFREVG